MKKQRWGKQYKPLCLMIMVFCLLLVTPIFVSAFEFDNVKLSTDELDQWGYPEITIVNAFNIPLLRKDLAKIKLDNHQPQCLTDCNSRPEISLYEPAILIEDIRFVDKNGKEYDLEYDITLKYIEEYEEEVIDKITEVCEDILNNSKIVNICHNEYTYKNVIKEREEVEVYNLGEEKDVGDYKPNIHVTKPLGVNIDYQMKINGRWIEELAWWDTDWKKCRDLDFSTADTYTDIITTINVTDIDFVNATKEIRIVNAVCGDDGSEVLRTVLDAGTDWAYITFLLSGTGAFEYSVYYDNVGASAPSNLVLFWDEFNIDGLNTEKWGYNDTSGTLNVTDGYLGFDGDGNWGGINSITQFSTGFLWAEKKNDGADHHVMGFTDDPEITQRATIYWFGGNRKFNIPAENAYGRDDSLLNYTISWDGGGAGNCYSLSLPDNEGVSVANCASGSSVLRLKAHGIDIYNFVRVYPFGTNYTGEPQSWTIGGEQAIAGLDIVNSIPINNSNISETSITFGCNVTGVGGTNLTSIILSVTGDAVWNQTIMGLNTKSYNATFVNSTIEDGDYSWKCFGIGDTANGDSNTWVFSKDTIIPNINAFLNPLIITMIDENVTINYTITDVNLDSCIYQYNGINISINCISGINNITNITSVFPETEVVIYVNDTFGHWNVSALNFSYDTTFPQIEIILPTSLLGFGYVGKVEELNYSITSLLGESHLDSFWFEYNGTNTTLNGAINSTTFNLSVSPYNLTLWANDSLGNTNSSFISWEYVILETNQTFNNLTFSGATESFTFDFILGEGFSISNAVMNYNGTNYTSNILSIGDGIRLTNTITVPIVNLNTNFSFSFIITADGQMYETQINQQLVSIINMTDCSGGGTLILNMTLKDEKMKTNITGDIEINVQTLDKASFTAAGFANISFEDVNSGAICFEPAGALDNLLLDAEIRYTSDGYATELYYIQRADLSDIPILINLFDLNSNESTEFLVTYQDDNLIFVEGAVLQLQRKYIAEDLYEVVEAPLTSDSGTAIVHIDLDTNKYKVIIVKDGVVLDIFENIVFSCDNELSGQCTQKLLGQINPQNDIPITELTDFSVAITQSNDTITTIFSIPSGVPSSVNVVMTQTDQFNNTNICNETVFSSAGAIECTIIPTIGDSFIELSIKKSGEIQSQKGYIVHEDFSLDFAGNNYFILFILMLSVIGMAFTSPEWIIINGVITMVLAGALYLATGVNFVVGLGNIIWLLIAAVILIIKISHQEDR